MTAYIRPGFEVWLVCIKWEGRLGFLDVFRDSALGAYDSDFPVFRIQVHCLFLSFFLIQVVSGSKTEKYYQGLLIELFATDDIKLK